MAKPKKAQAKPKKIKSGKKLPTPVLKTQGFFAENKYIIMAFLAPFLLMSVAFAVQNVAPFGILKTMYESVAYQIGQLFPSLGITVVPNTTKPWGDQQMLVIDLWHQYYPFLCELQEKLQTGGSLFWSWSVGLGTNFIAMMSYYLLSPLNFLSVFLPREILVEYLAVATVIKISCAGMFTAIAFKILFKKDGLPLVIAGVLFALCSFNMGYYWCTIWLDSVAMLPLVFAGTICLLRDGKFKLFTISLALAVVFNYYIGLFICFAVFLTAIGYTVSRFVSFKKSFKDLLRTIVCTVSSLLMTAPITVPAYLALQNCYKSSSTFPTTFDINIGEDTAEGVLDAIHLVFSNLISFITPTYKEGLPNVACGIFCVVLLAVFFCCRKIKLGEKLFCCFTMLFLVASFIFRHLDYVWHGMHYPNMLPYRFSFLMSFLLIYMAFRAYTLLEKGEYIDVVIGALVFALVIFGYFLREDEDIIKEAAYASIAVGVAIVVLLLLYTLKIAPKKLVSTLLTLIVLGEMCANAIIGVGTVGSTSMSSYPKEETHVNRLVEHIDTWTELDPDLARTEVSSTQTINDGALNSYNGISVFNSMANANITNYTEYLGLAGWPAGNRYTYYQSSPVTNVIFNLKYIIARNDTCYDTTYMKEIDKSAGVTLWENQAYLPMGFMTEYPLKYFNVNVPSANPGTVDNPFENQITWWRLATGIEEPVYTEVALTNTEYANSSVDVRELGDGKFTAYPQGGSSEYAVHFDYTIEEDSLVLAYFKLGSNSGDGTVLINDTTQSSRNVKMAHIMNLGTQSAGTKVSLKGKIETSASYSSIRVYCYALNEEVFEKGLEILGESTLDATKVTDTTIEGTISVKENGLLYTSIPYEKGWKVKVDGKEQEVIAIGDGVCAVSLSEGEHTVKFYYIPHGFVTGVIAFVIGLAILVLMCIFTSKRQKEKGSRNFFLWLADPNVSKVTDEVEDENGLPTARTLDEDRQPMPLAAFIPTQLFTLGLGTVSKMPQIACDLHRIAYRYDNKKTASYWTSMLGYAVITLGLFPFVWYHDFTKRVEDELKRRNLGFSFSVKDFWLYAVLGSLIIIGPYFYYKKLYTAMNMLSQNYNQTDLPAIEKERGEETEDSEGDTSQEKPE